MINSEKPQLIKKFGAIGSTDIPNLELLDSERAKYNQVVGIGSWLMEYEVDYFITLTFKHPVKDCLQARDIVNRFINLLSKNTYGKRSLKRVKVVPILERNTDDRNSYHVHILMQDPRKHMTCDIKATSYNIKQQVVDAWKKSSNKTGSPSITSKNMEWFKTVNNEPKNKERLIGYVLKQIDASVSKENSPILYDCISFDGRKPIRA